MVLGVVLVVAALLPPSAGAARRVRVAATPPMGWDSWDSFGCGVTESDVKRAAKALVRSGLRDAGYRYVIIDDCWFDPNRRADGALRVSHSKFPSGMRALARYLHRRGLLLGIYESPAQKTCAQVNGLYPGSTGSLGHELEDARTFAAWGVDYLKYDYCSPVGTLRDQIVTFIRMRDAIRDTGRPIVYSINPNSFHGTTGITHNWSRVANEVRTSQDLAPVWDTGQLQPWYVGIANAIWSDAPLAARAGPGHWNDPGILVAGLRTGPYSATVGSPGLNNLLKPTPRGRSGLSLQEMRTNLAMWAVMAAPLIVGADPRRLSPEVRRMLLNRRLIAIDQDPLGRQGRPVRGDWRVWAKPLSHRAVAAALFNPYNAWITIPTTARKLGLPGASRYTVEDVGTGASWTNAGAVRATVPPHGVVVLRIAPRFRHRRHR
jgi:alpha-galactosidase